MNIWESRGKTRGTRFKFLVTILILCLISVSAASFVALDYSYAANGSGTVNSSIGLNVRSGPGTSYSILGVLSNGAKITIISTSNGWHKISYGSGYGYVSADLVKVTQAPTSGSSGSSSSGSGSSGSSGSAYSTPSSDTTFEKSIAAFPDSYKPYLRALHVKYPKWKFNALNTGLNWDDVIAKETAYVGTNLVPSSWGSAYKSYASGALTASGSHIIFDSGGYVAASVSAVKYYMDPRNFLNENSIFQFLSNKYDSSTQTEAGVNNILSGSFMDKSKGFPEDTYSTYAKVILAAGKANGVNPLTLASMILTEQGYYGNSGLISGKFTIKGHEDDLKGYYNYFNVGAYAAGGNSAVVNGLLRAKKENWTTRATSIIKGAAFYAKNYVNAGKYTIYLQKFNVMNGLSKVGTGQYMTAVYAANTEGVILKNGYKNQLNTAITFEIPVYKNMPSKVSAVPTTSSGSSSSTASKSSNTITRLSGSSRYRTSLAVADKMKSVLGVNQFDNIIIASGNPDIVSASYLSVSKNAPIICVTTATLENAASYVKKNVKSGGTVYIIGSSKVVPRSIEKSLSGYKISRLWGSGKYETNLAVLRASGVKNQDIMVCATNSYADAMCASATGKPILLVGSSLTSNQKKFLAGISPKTIYVIGGTSAISKSLANSLKRYGTVKRVGGSGKYNTSLQIAKTFFPASHSNNVLVCGTRLAYSISAGPLAAKLNAPLILVSSSIYKDAVTYAKGSGGKNFYVIGGTSIISNTVANAFKY